MSLFLMSGYVDNMLVTVLVYQRMLEHLLLISHGMLTVRFIFTGACTGC